ncbi:hypothetical protein ACB092_01G255100 [Castanea dentata]
MSFSNFKVLPESITCLLNLQTLKLDYCHYLQKLPNCMRYMKNLIYLGLSYCDPLTCMPKGIGQLTCLQSLSIFIVGKENDYQLSELKELHLRNELSIKELHNVRNFEEAKNANLIGTQNLYSLSLVWQNKSQCPVPKHVEDVLDGLQPHSNLKVLRIHNYLGSKFPTWMQDLLLYNLVQISLIRCERCEQLPPLDKLPSLKVLDIRRMDSMKYLGHELHLDSAISFPSLEILTLDWMPNLDEWRTIDGRENFPHLSTLNISDCPKLVELPIIPSITSLSINSSNAMLIKSVMNLSSLSSLQIGSMNESTLLPEGLQYLHSFWRLDISGCKKILSFPVNGLRGLSSLQRVDAKKTVARIGIRLLESPTFISAFLHQ